MANLKFLITKGRKRLNSNRFNNLPSELLTEILAKVASTSAIDLFQAKTSCKDFRLAASDDYVFQNIEIDSFVDKSWKIRQNGASNFLERCNKCGNPESLFRQGMIDYFSNLKIDSGFECLKKAANKGHVVATYVYGIILVCYGGELRKKGLKLLFELKRRSNSRLIVKECREKVRKIFYEMWPNINYIIGYGPAEEDEFKRKLKNCKCKAKLCSWTAVPRKESSVWKPPRDEEFEDDKFSCQACLWDLEAFRFLNFLRTKCFKVPFLL
ncbi:putative F-box protein At1g67623 [Mercurialis annua]|uniref:putative F-box protein At1g67623 n=1 Tax=Mercurialis annua TaxID=3986 RepID=UPI002160BB5E|nr:putative F-box protein At1g67623 [Mercurialis annua]